MVVSVSDICSGTPSIHTVHLSYEPIGIKQFNDDVFRFFYDGQASPLWQSLDSTAASHRLAVLYMVLAGGALMDPQKSPYNVEAERYHQLARAALFRSSIFDEPTLHAVQALVSNSYVISSSGFSG